MEFENQWISNPGASIFIPAIDRILTKYDLREKFETELRLGKIRRIHINPDSSGIIYLEDWIHSPFSKEVRCKILNEGIYEYPDTIIPGHYVPIQMTINYANQNAPMPTNDELMDSVCRLEDEIENLKRINIKMKIIIENQQNILENLFKK